MGSGSQIMAPAEERRADKGKLQAYEPETQRAFDEQEVRDGEGRSGVVDEEAPQGSKKVMGSDLT